MEGKVERKKESTGSQSLEEYKKRSRQKGLGYSGSEQKRELIKRRW